MNYILSPDYNWRLIASIVTETKDPEWNRSFPQWPLIALDAPCPLFTGEYRLIINQGGIQNRDISKNGKVLFKENVLPYLMQSIGADYKITGKLELHLAQGAVKRAILHYN